MSVRLRIGGKFKTQRINAVALIGGYIKPLAFKHMPEVAATITTSHFCAAHPMGIILMKFDTSWSCIIKARPTAMSVEFGRAIEQHLSAGCASVHTIGIEPVVFSTKRGLGSFFTQDSKLFGGQNFAPFIIRSSGHLDLLLIELIKPENMNDDVDDNSNNNKIDQII